MLLHTSARWLSKPELSRQLPSFPMVGRALSVFFQALEICFFVSFIVAAQPLVDAYAGEEFKINGDPEKGKALYQLHCMSCHGMSGAGDGGCSSTLKQKPRALNDKAYMDSLTDEHIFKVIKDGGASAGLSDVMGAWGEILKTEAAIHDVAAYVRSLAD